MSVQSFRMALARALLDEQLNKVCVLLSEPHDDGPVNPVEAEQQRRAAHDMVMARLQKAQRALHDFEEAARGS